MTRAVEVIWPCGQIQNATVRTGEYHTLSLGWPEVLKISVKAYLSWYPGDVVVDWVFEWESTYPSDMSLNSVDFPDGVADDGNIVYSLDSSMPDVNHSVSRTTQGMYRYKMIWENRPCDQILSIPYTIHSRALNKDFSWSKVFNVINCPETP